MSLPDPGQGLFPAGSRGRMLPPGCRQGRAAQEYPRSLLLPVLSTSAWSPALFHPPDTETCVKNPQPVPCPEGRTRTLSPSVLGEIHSRPQIPAPARARPSRWHPELPGSVPAPATGIWELSVTHAAPTRVTSVMLPAQRERVCDTVKYSWGGEKDPFSSSNSSQHLASRTNERLRRQLKPC